MTETQSRLFISVISVSLMLASVFIIKENVTNRLSCHLILQAYSTESSRDRRSNDQRYYVGSDWIRVEGKSNEVLPGNDCGINVATTEFVNWKPTLFLWQYPGENGLHLLQQKCLAVKLNYQIKPHRP